MGRVANLFLLLCITAIWASSFAVIHDVSRVMTPFTFMFWRFFLSFLCLAPWVLRTLYRTRGNRSLRWERLSPFHSLGLAVLIGSGIILQTIGTTMTSTSRAAFITTLFIVLIPIISYLLPKVLPRKWLGDFHVPKVTKMLLTGLGLSFSGLILIMLPGGEVVSEGGPSPSFLGDFLVFLCTFGLAGHIILIQLLPKTVDVIAITGLQFLWVALFCLVGVWAYGEPLLGPVHWPGLLYMVLGVTLTTFLIQIWVQPRVNTVEATAIYSLEPLFATLLGWAFLAERPTPLALGGGALLVSGVLFIEVFPALLKKKTRHSTIGGHPPSSSIT